MTQPGKVILGLQGSAGFTARWWDSKQPQINFFFFFLLLATTKINIRFSLMAEILEIFLATQQTSESGYKNIFIASDSQHLIKATNSESQLKELHKILNNLSLSIGCEEFFFSFSL